MIRDIWGKLRDLSEAYGNHRGLGSDEQGNKSPEAPAGVGLALRLEIFREINLYCLPKQIKRLEIYSRREFGSPWRRHQNRWRVVPRWRWRDGYLVFEELYGFFPEIVWSTCKQSVLFTIT